MYKLILKDYRSHFKSSIKKLWNDSGLFVILYYCLYLINARQTFKEDLIHLSVVVPCLIAYLLSRMYGGCLSKTFYLCPMDAGDRREHAIKNYRLRVIISTVIFMVPNIVFLIMGEYDIAIFLIRLFAFGCTVISINIYCQPKYLPDLNKKVTPFIGNYTTVEIISNIVNIFAIIVVTCITSNSFAEIETATKIVFLLIFLCQVCVTVVKVKKFFWQSITVMEFYK